MAFGNPFNFSNWLKDEGSPGGYDSGDDFELGRQNHADVDHTTMIIGYTANNAVFSSLYFGADFHGKPIPDPGVGLYGEGRRDRGIGVAGVCTERGSGVYGMALDNGAGVVGRSMSGDDSETVPPVDFVGRPAGVLGQAKNGVGVFGHGGPLTEPQISAPPDPDPGVRGGIFSAGWRSLQNIKPAQEPQLVSLSSRPQIQLLPSNNQTLPAQAQLGDMYFVIAEHGAWASAGQLWICTQIQGTTPIWQPVTLGNAQAGGSQVPQS